MSMTERRLYIGNLPYRTTTDELRDLFSRAGEVTDVAVPTDRETGRPRGFAFVEMADEDGARQAIEMFNGYSLGGRQLRVNESQPREGGGGRGGYGGGGRGGGGYGGGGDRGGYGGD